MKKILIMAGALGLTAFSYAGSGNAAFNYNFVEGQYVDMRDVSLHDERSGIAPFNRRVDASLDGLRIKGSFDIAPSFSIIGSVLDARGNKSDLTVVTVGAAYHQSLPAIKHMPFDLVLRAEIEHVDSDIADTETGILLGGGAQLAIIDKLKAFSELSLSSNDYREVSLLAGARYEFIPALEGTLTVEAGDMEMIAAGLRYSF